MDKKKLTKAECKAMGGHCWESDGRILASYPPQYREHCKHCPAIRVAIPRDAFEYRGDE